MYVCVCPCQTGSTTTTHMSSPVHVDNRRCILSKAAFLEYGF